MRLLIETYGVVPALVCAKGAALAIIYCLANLADKVRWIPIAMKGVIVIYLVFAIVPWSAILLNHVL